MKSRNLFFITIIILILSAWSYRYFDLTALKWAKAHPNAYVKTISIVVQHSLAFSIWGWLVPLVLMMLWWRAGGLGQALSRRATQVWLGLLIAMFLCFVFKTFLGRYRPEMYLSHHLYGFSWGFTHDYSRLSMPSDHAALIFSMITSCIGLIRSKFLTIILVLLGLGCTISRVMYIQHYPSDVGVGILIGVWSSYLAFWFCERFRKKSC